MTSSNSEANVVDSRTDEKMKEEDTFLDSTLPHDEERAQETPNPPATKCKFVTLRTFVLVSGALMCAQSALSMYTKSVLTSIEMRFQISSSLAGLIVGSFNFGNMLFVVLVSKLSSNGHRPRIMAVGSMVVAMGGFFNVIPHLASTPYEPVIPKNTSVQLLTEDASIPTYVENSTTTDSDESLENSIQNCASSNLYILLIIGEMLQGIGATVLVPLGSSYVDDYAKSGNSPLYLGIMFLLQNLGPGVGYLVGSLSTSLYVDFDRVHADAVEIRSADPSWVGAWWLGYIIIGVCVILAAVPLFWFPLRMEEDIKVGKKVIRGTQPPMIPKSGDPDIIKNKDDTVPLNGLKKDNIPKPDPLPKSSSSSARKMLDISTDLYVTIKRLLTNPVYMLIVMGYSGLMFVVGALTAFMPKFLEVIFFQSKSQASLTFGLSMPIVICIGLFSGGLIVHRQNWSITNTMRFICVVAGATIFLCIPPFYVTCHPEPLPCKNETSNESTSTLCSDERGETCRNESYIFVAVMSLAALLCCHIVTPSYSVILRNVNPKDKCTAIGLKFLIIRLVAFIPSPMITGAVIDDACIEWSFTSDDCDGTSTCLRYEREKFRVSYLTIILLGVSFTFFFNFLGCLVLRHEKKAEKKKDLNITEEEGKLQSVL